MQHGDVSAVIVIPKGLADRFEQDSPVAIQLYTDPTKTQATQVVQGPSRQIANRHEPPAGRRLRDREVEQQTLQSTNISNAAYLVPSILAMALMQLGVFAAIPLVQQREKGILKRMGATPLPRWKLVGSNILLRLMVAIVDAVVILGIGLMFFNVQIVGNVLAMAGLVLLGAGAFLALGFMLASFLKTEEQATGVVQVVQMPMMFLSGIFFSFDFMPDFLQTVGRAMPLTYLADALRQVMVNGTQVAPLGRGRGDPHRLAGGLPGRRRPHLPLGVAGLSLGRVGFAGFFWLPPPGDRALSPDPTDGRRPRFGLGGRARRHNAELLHHRQSIDDAPVLAHETVVAEAEHVDELHVDALSGGRHAHELTPVGPGVPHAGDDLVTVRDDVFHVHAQVRERRELHPEELLDPVFRRREARRLLVLDEIVCQMLSERADISGVDRVVQTPRSSRVIHVF